MIKSNPHSRFTLKTLEEIRDTRGDVILQIEKTDTHYEESKKPVYLCEVVASFRHDARTVEQLVDEVVSLNKEIRRLRNKIDKLQREAPNGKAD